MSLIMLKRYFSRHLPVMMTMIMLSAAGLMPLPRAYAADTSGSGQKICDPNVCIIPKDGQTPKQAKDEYAKENSCTFIEDACPQGSPANDHVGAAGKDDSAVFGNELWPKVKDSLTYGYEFIKGLVEALGSQVSNLFDGVTDPDKVADGLVQLGNAYYQDPDGTLAKLGGMLGQDNVVAQTNNASQCGSYDKGKVIGGFVNPGFATKFVKTLSEQGGNVDAAIDATNTKYGCASFGAGTQVMTPDGLRNIETINVGDRVFSRNEVSYADTAQRVTDTFTRIAPSYRNLTTERGSFKVTDEHPVWVQGKGWTVASKLAVGDVIASEQGDALVTGNEAVKEPLRVYNMTIANTSNYFVGSGGMWAHNSNCLGLMSKPWADLTPNQKGFVAEYNIYLDMKDKGYTPVGKSFDPTGMTPDQAYKGWKGQTGIDGLYKGPNNSYIIVESKATGSDDPGDPSNKTAGLASTADGKQMSDKWVLSKKRLDKLVIADPDPAVKSESQQDIDNVKAGLSGHGTPQNGVTVTKIYAQTDKNGTGYYSMTDDPINPQQIKVGGPVSIIPAAP